MMIRIVFISLIVLLNFSVFSQKKLGYKIPHEEILKLVNAPNTPSVSIDPQGKWMLQLNYSSFSSIQELSQTEIRIAGLRINPETNGPSRLTYYDSLALTNLETGKEYSVAGVPEQARIQNITWSPNGMYVAFTHTVSQGIELWVLDVEKKKVEKYTEGNVNAALLHKPIQWADNGEWIVYAAISEERGNVPAKRTIPTGPIVRETDGKEAAVRTYQDLIKSPYDAAMFKYYALSQLTKINLQKETYPIGNAAIFKTFSFSPDKQYLLVKMIHEPFSYIVPYYRFPYKVEVWNNEGALWRELFDIPVAENIPKGFGAVRKGPRNIAWRNDKPSSLYWVRAMDGGDPNRLSVTRDRLFLFEPPFDGDGIPCVFFEKRFGDIVWGKDDLAVVSEWWWEDRTETISYFDPSEPAKKKQVLYTYDWQDEYNHPGSFTTVVNEYGRDVLHFDAKMQHMYLKGKGGTPEGYKPFVDKFSIDKQTKERLWQSNDPYYEYPISVLDAKKNIMLTRRESKSDVPNYFARNLKNGVVKQITNFTNPYPQLLEAKQELVKYSRKDGVQLTGKLYLPPGYSVGDSLLPVLMWAYPNEYKSAAAAGQIKASPNQFIRIGWWSPIFWITRGYAVFDRVAMPIVGEGDEEPNDSFVEQLVWNAEAAIQVLDSMGIADKNKVAIGGHSYGAFMTANLLSHSDLFAAGIARSGAYNRTLTPFGFQAEERTFWEATDVYIKMSPFSYANQIKEPLLLIHGEADNNSGTYPLQSERYFTALKGNGGNARLVMLPHESHSYKARESIYHMLWEMDRWLYKYVKNKND